MPDDERIDDETEAELDGGREPSLRPFWSGTLSFGLVSIPVSLFPASRRGGVPLRMLAPDGTPLARRYYCPEENVEVDGEHLVRGFELEDGTYVVVSDEELEAVDPKKSRDIDLRLFVPAESIDPIYFERTYVLTSAAESTKAYRLLAEVMERQGRAGIATFVMRENEYVIAIFAERGILHGQTLRFADEVRDVAEIGLPDVEPDAALVDAFAKAIAARTVKRFPAEELRDSQTEALRAHLEQKLRKDQGVVHAPGAEPAAQAEVIDLMDVLRRSLQAGEAAQAGGAEPERPEPRASERARPASRRARSQGPDRPARTGPSARELEQLSKEELLRRARNLDVPGRSHMTKAQLAREVKKRGKGAA